MFSEIRNRIRMPITGRIVLIAIIVLASAGMVIRLAAELPQTSPDLNVKVTTFDPSRFTEIKGNITVKFSRDMVPDDSLDIPVFDTPLQFDPPIPGIARWVEKSILRFFPDEPLKPATEYTAKVESDKVFLYGNKINDDREFKFQTQSLQLEYAWDELLAVKDSADYRRMKISLGFNYPVDVKELVKHAEIKGGSGAVKKSLSFEVKTPEGHEGEDIRISSDLDFESYRGSYDAYIITEPFLLTDNFQNYDLIINDDFRCLDCTNPLWHKYVKTFGVDRKQRLIISRVWVQGIGTGFQINAYFNLPIDPETAADYVTIDKVKPRMHAEYSTLVIQGDFEPGKSYEIKIEKGMPSANGTILENEYSSIVTVPDLSPSVRFTANGRYLPLSGTGLIELETVNVGKVTVEVEEIFANNILHFLQGGHGTYNAYGRNSTTLGRSFFTKDYELSYTKNQPLKNSVDIAGMIGGRNKGIFKISVRSKDSRWVGDGRYIMLTDIGLSARLADDYLMVWANSLDDTHPLNKATVRLISSNNQTIVEGTTDSRGIATFDKLKSKLEGFEPYLIVVTKDNDMSYLQFDQARLPVSEYDVSGRPLLTDGYEAFVYTDRGIYRPGDTVHIVSVIRGADAAMPQEFPYIVSITDPRGNKYEEFKNTAGKESLDPNDFIVPAFAGTGRYNITARIGDDYTIGQAAFMVEEFMPDRIKVQAEAGKSGYRAGETMIFDVVSKYLFGPPASGLKASGHITIESEFFSAKGYSKYSFNDETRSFKKLEIDLPDTVLDSLGKLTYRYKLEDKIKAPSMLKGLFSVNVSEQGGRAVGGYTEVKIFPYEDYVGIKGNIQGYAKTGNPVEYEVIGMDLNGQHTAIDSVEVMVYRLVYNSMLRADQNGYYRYVSEETAIEVESRLIAVDGKPVKEIFTPDKYGRYRIIARDLKGGHAASVNFYVSGWGYAPWAMTNPDRLEIGLDKAVYAAGEKASVQIRAPFGGKLLLTVERDKVLEFMTVDMENNTADIELEVKKDYFPNVYITGTLIKSADKIEQTLPARAFGMAPLVLSNEKKNIAIEIKAPDEIKPNTKLPIEIQLNPPRAAEVTVAAVDLGILQLTAFDTPDPLEYFHGKKRPYPGQYDIYSFIFPEIGKHESNLSPAGGMLFGETLKRHVNPVRAQRVKPTALWSGVVRTDDAGHATIDFNVPQFNGGLRIMAVASAEDQFGSNDKEVVVRDKIVIQESFPRFTAPNDEIEGLVSVFNNTGADATIAVGLKLEGPAELIGEPVQNISVKDNSEATAIFKFKTTLVPGRIDCMITATSGAERSEIDFELPNRPYQQPYTEFGSGLANVANPAEFTLPGDWLEGTARFVIQTSAGDFAGLARGLEYLLSYPYGCIEQTTSRIMPLLYFENLVKFARPDLIGSKGHEYFVQEGLMRLMEFQRRDGSFSFWPGSNEYFNPWGSLYAGHSIIEAKQAGYTVDKDFYKQTVDFIKSVARGEEIRNLEPNHRIYAAYILARAGLLEKRAINYMKSINPGSVPPYSKYQMAGVLALSGETDYAKELLPKAIEPATFSPESGGSFSSGVRTTAILLDVLFDADPANPGLGVLANSLADNIKNNRWYTTQETAFALMALGRYLKNLKPIDFIGTITIAGDSTYRIDTSLTRIKRNDLNDKEILITIKGNGDCHYAWQATGINLSHAPEEFSRGINITREYFDEDGNKLDSSGVELGSRVICAIKVTATDGNLEYVVIDDMIPAGFEIENPRLKTTPRLSWISKGTTDYQYSDIRDDRIMYFVDLLIGKPKEFYYSLRAISAGDFAVPPVMAECMYNPSIGAASSSGRIKIVR